MKHSPVTYQTWVVFPTIPLGELLGSPRCQSAQKPCLKTRITLIRRSERRTEKLPISVVFLAGHAPTERFRASLNIKAFKKMP